MANSDLYQCTDEELPLISVRRDRHRLKSSENSWKPLTYSISITLVLYLTFFLATINVFQIKDKVNGSFDELKPEMEILIRKDGYIPILSVSQSNEEGLNTTTYDVFKNYIGVIEPHSPMILEVINPVVDLTYSYNLVSNILEEDIQSGSLSILSATSTSFSSEIFTVACNPYDTFKLKISAISSTQETVIETTNSVICMYVRREIRSLSLSDLNKTLDVMLEIYTLGEEEGRAKYGDNFHSSTHFTEWHFFNAAQRDADHIHEGMGFLPQHIKETNQFELAMQAIDPSITLPYWDFTIEGEAGLAIYNSTIFTPEIFGSCPLPKDMDLGFSYSKDSMLDAAIPNGRWAKIKADLNTKYSDMNQPYGYLRSPWNMNPNPYISRYTYTGESYKLPTCSSYINLLEMSKKTTFLSEVAFDTHGTTHTLPGGLIGCELLLSFIDLGYVRNATALNLCATWPFVIKNLYRYHFVALPTNCVARSYDFNGIDGCPFICKDTEAVGVAAAIFMGDYGYTMTDPYTGNISPNTYIADFICNGNASKIYTGDHLESASPADPSFWPIHPTVDRALQVKYLVGGFEYDDWPDEDEIVCTLSTCYEDDSGVAASNSKCCYGHHATDKVMDYVNGNSSNYIGPTNEEVLLSLNPSANSSSYAMPYIYDHFSWKHCEVSGNSIAVVLAALKANNGY
jgi:hypothetical protein